MFQVRNQLIKQMRILIKHKDTFISISENGDDDQDRVASIRWSDQNKQIQETIKVMTEQVIKIINSVKNE